jgi:hypothetical protein
MSVESSPMAEQLLKSASRQLEAREVLNQPPPTGVRSWQVPLVSAMGTAVAVAMYVSGQSPITSALVGAALLATNLAVAASAETRRLANRLAAVEAILLRRPDAA